MANETIMQTILDDAHLTELMATLRKEISDFNLLTRKAVNPETFDSDAQWAVSHDDNWDYNTHHILNIDNKRELDDEYAALTGENSFMQQRLHLLQNVTPQTKHETIRKAIEIEYITSRLDCLKYDYNQFLMEETIDEEDFQTKYDRVRDDIASVYGDEMRNAYCDEMREYEGWSDSDVRDWWENGEDVPEDWANDYYDECYL